ncbi:cation:proton antiporter [Ktedonobacter robiniae]|uniref:Cation/H+ exchanger transmembrane domain-containing protein n=1 Tax=Ktedonobacter robiniae TaxID=2778365 RepID=A0ABQ3V5E7_9CHLR|nr:cation:proton antiporter [Ktedonobacter robiniae]GHO60138.1 hypothetical protein KSB_86130 [Ktedonobacter robiniae]
MYTGQILLQLIVILLAVQLFGYLSKWVGVQWVIGEILAGLVLGPSLLGGIFPGVEALLFPTATLPMLQTLGDIGLILYMFSLGTRLDVQLMLRHSKQAAIVSACGILLPFASGSILAYFLYPYFAGPRAAFVPFVLLMGTAMSITAFPVLARLLAEKRMLGTKVGMLALTCASVDDVVAWCLLAFVVATIHAHDFTSIFLIVGLTVAFIGVMLLVVRPLLKYAVQRVSSPHLLLAINMGVLLLASFSTNAIGIHPIFGAFLTGVIVPRKVRFVGQVRSLDQVNNLLFLPLFFVFSGLRTQIGLIQGPALLGICALILGVACLGKILGGALPVAFSGESWHTAISLGVLMNTRGLVELIVLNIGYELGILSPTLFAMLVIMALVTTMMASPLLPLLGYRTSLMPTETISEQLDGAMALGVSGEGADE